MLRLPPFIFRRPRTLDEACRILDGEGAASGRPVRVVAGGTPLTVPLARTYTSPVVVCSATYAANTTPVVVRVSQATSSSFVWASMPRIRSWTRSFRSPSR